MPQQTGLFDTRSQEQILNDRWRERHNETMGMVPQIAGRDPASQSAGALGGMLAGAIGKRFAPPTLTPEEQARTGAIASATERTNKWRLDNPNASVEDIGLITTKHMGEELLRNGDMQGLQFAQAWAQQERAKRQSDLEITKLEGEVEDAQVERDFWRVKNTLRTVWPTDPEFGDEGFEAFLTENGDAVYLDEQGKEQTLTRGQYTRYDPKQPYANSRNGGRLKPADLGWTPTQMGTVRALGVNIPRTAAALMNMQNALKSDVERSGTVELLGTSGKINSWVDDTVSSFSALARSVGNFFTVDGKNLSSEDSAMKYVAENPELIEAMSVHMPDTVKATTLSKARWTAAAVRLAFSNGQSLEPGQRNMSDQDFRIQLETTGALTTDPEAFRQISVMNFKDAWDNYQMFYDTAPEEIQTMIMAPAGAAKIAQARADFDSSFAQPFGTAGKPGTGLTESPTTGAPDGVTQEEWDNMTPEEKALFN